MTTMPNPRLPIPLAVPELLRAEGACASGDVDPDLFAWTDGPDAERPADGGAAARTLCGGCPVAPQCLAYAMKHEAHGIWGGLTPRERELASGVRRPDVTAAQHAYDLDVELSRSTVEQVAKGRGVAERTVYRWKVDRAQARDGMGR